MTVVGHFLKNETALARVSVGGGGGGHELTATTGDKATIVVEIEIEVEEADISCVFQVDERVDVEAFAAQKSQVYLIHGCFQVLAQSKHLVGRVVHDLLSSRRPHRYS